MGARYKESQGQIYDTSTGRWMGEFTSAKLHALNGGGSVEDDGDLSSKTVAQLRTLAKDLEVEGFSSMNKSQLVEAVEAAQAEAADGDDSSSG